MKVLYVRVRPKNPEADDLGWAVIINGHLVATDGPNEMGPLCGEIADGVAQALGTVAEEREVVVSGDWGPDDWNWREILIRLGETPQPAPVVLSVQEDVAALVESGDPRLLPKVRAAVQEGKITPDVVRRAAEIARDAILGGGYWDYLAVALEEAVEKQETGL